MDRTRVCHIARSAENAPVGTGPLAEAALPPDGG